MKQDPESTLPWVLKNLNDADQLAVIKDSLNEDAPQETDFEMANWLIQHPHPHAKSATESFLRRLQDREAAIEWVASLETIHQRRFMPAVFADWMKQSPAEAEKYLKSLSSPRAEARLINHTERLMWSDEDKKAFKDWALPRLSQEARQMFP